MPGRAHRLCQPRRGTGSGRRPLPVYQHHGADIGAGRGSASVVRQVSANTFKVTKPDGKTFTVTGVRPVSVPGPWVITKIA